MAYRGSVSCPTPLMICANVEYSQIDLKNAWGWVRTPDMSIAGVLNSGIIT